jgi:phage head maturation protease
MIFGTHEAVAAFARTKDHSLTLFQDRYGLGFEARMSTGTPGVFGIARAIARGDTTRASVNFTDMDCTTRHEADARHRRVTRARIDHIAIVSQAAYEGTAVWLADSDIRDLPPRIAALQARWSPAGAISGQREREPRG